MEQGFSHSVEGFLGTLNLPVGSSGVCNDSGGGRKGESSGGISSVSRHFRSFYLLLKFPCALSQLVNFRPLTLLQTIDTRILLRAQL